MRSEVPSGPDRLTVRQVSALSGYAEKTVYRAIDAGRLRATKPATHWRIERTDYEQWMDSQPAPVAHERVEMPSPVAPLERGSSGALRTIECEAA